jgi:hypothetical protein
MNKREKIREELNALNDEAFKLASAFQKEEVNNLQYRYQYQAWYTKAINAVAALAPERLAEFRSYYEVDPRRKGLGYDTFVIQDFFRGVIPSGPAFYNFDSHNEALTCFFNQTTILHAVTECFDSVILNIEGQLYAELKDNEVAVAKQLIKLSPRAAGALMGVLIEGHLQKVAASHGLKVAKKHPTIVDLNDPLKNESVIDTPTWRKISYLADLRNLCSHRKDSEPTKEQVEELIAGADWLIKNVF